MKFVWQDPKDPENVLTVVRARDVVYISVSEERAMDSYNETFECTACLNLAEARALHLHLTNILHSNQEESPS
jgi:hypothetical protein